MLSQKPVEDWWMAYKDVLAPDMTPDLAKYVMQESNSSTILAFNSTWMCGFLQTRRYARATLTSVPLAKHSAATIDRMVDLRLTRQWQIFERDQPLQVRVVLDESILRRQIGGVGVLREQLLHLQTILHTPGLELRILPSSSKQCISVQDFRLLCDKTRGNWTTFNENGFRLQHQEEPFTVQSLLVHWETLHQCSLSENESRTLIRRVIDELPDEFPETNEQDLSKRSSQAILR